ncbi:MAG: BamA/TamA family outer membrane protein, partial [Proteobacteria bacterium]|nr:BamA/TamA family outer membrane protein [Pseudomonadota bacterium]
MIFGLFLTWLTAMAQGQELAPNWYVGLPIASIALHAPEGGLPEESLEPLLRAKQGEDIWPGTLRIDMATLFRVGEFSAVEADLEPWFIYGADGQMREAVQVTYVVRPAPRVARIKISGNKALKDRELLEASRITAGQVFYEYLDGPIAKTALVKHLGKKGYVDADITIDVIELDEGQQEINVQIDEGQPNILGQLFFVGELPEGVTRQQLIRWARKAGVQTGKPFAKEAVSKGQYAILSEMGRMGTIFRRHRGYISARVTPAVVRDVDGSMAVTYTIESGPRLKLDIEGVSWRPQAKVQKALGIDERLRLTRGFLEEAPLRLKEYLQGRGYYEAQTSVTLIESRDTQTLKVGIDRGPVHTISGFRYEGNKYLEARRLTAVMQQSSEDVLRHGFYTEPELAKGLSAAHAYCRAHGFQGAKVALDHLDNNKARFNPLGLFGIKRRRLTLHFAVDEGPLTTSRLVTVQGSSSAVDLAFADEVASLLQGQPFSPQALELLSRKVVDVHQKAGFLDADARVVHLDEDDNQIESIIHVTPGEQILLRSVITRGPRRTRPSFVRRQVDLVLGKPITSTEIDRIKRSLYDLGVFRSVDLHLLGDETARDLVIAVEERPLWGFELGGGVSTDQGVRAFGRATRRNLLRRAHHLDAYGAVGLEYRDLFDPEWQLVLSYTAPRFPLRSQETVLHLLLRERMLERSWTMARSGLGASIDSTFGNFRLRGGARLELRQLEVVDAGSLILGEAWEEMIGRERPDLPSKMRTQEVVSALVLYDRRDNPMQPTKGIAVSAIAEWVPGVITLTDRPRTSFLKAEGNVSVHFPLGGLQFHLSAGGGVATPLFETTVVPLEDRFRLGGTGSMRGFKRDVIGPRNRTSRVNSNWPDGLAPIIDYTLRDSPERWAPTGGDAQFLGTFELNLPLPLLGMPAWEGYAIAFFADVGNVWLT